MEITTNYLDGNAIVAMAGRLDTATSQQAMQDIEEQLKASVPSMNWCAMPVNWSISPVPDCAYC